MIDIGVASPSAHGQAMMRTRDGGDQRKGEARLRPEDRPGDECGKRDRDDKRHEPGGDAVRKPLDRRAAALRFGDHLHDARQHRVAADFLGAHDEAAGAVDRAGRSRARPAPCRPASIRRSPSIRRSRCRPSITMPSTGTFSPGRTRRRSPTATAVERHLLVAAVGARRGARSSARGSRARGSRRRGRSRARNSSTWPSSTSTVIMAAASK